MSEPIKPGTFVEFDNADHDGRVRGTVDRTIKSDEVDPAYLIYSSELGETVRYHSELRIVG